MELRPVFPECRQDILRQFQGRQRGEKPYPVEDSAYPFESHEVLVRVIATIVTTADCMMRRGDTVLSRIFLGFRKPRKKYQIPGTEFSGVVESVGQKVSKPTPMLKKVIKREAW
ncbi:MAG: hypothetical protein EOM90_05725 [Alphaproteobacteria bacterium]|nr:hypothetical protein [Alphaproteobacteria bacterium]